MRTTRRDFISHHAKFHVSFVFNAYQEVGTVGNESVIASNVFTVLPNECVGNYNKQTIHRLIVLLARAPRGCFGALMSEVTRLTP